MVIEPTLFDLEPEAQAWVPIEGAPAPQPCRDCGRTKFTWERGCGGARGHGSYNVCDDCAALDGRGQRGDGDESASRWGIATTDAEAERLTQLQRKRQGAWLRANRPVL